MPTKPCESTKIESEFASRRARGVVAVLKHPAVRWLLPLLRYGLCAAAVVYLYSVVSWNDYVVLNDSARTRVRLLEQRGDTFVVSMSGEPRELSASEVHFAGDPPIADIRYGIGSVVTRMNVRQALLAILLFLPVPFLSAVRLVWMLRIQDVRLGWWDSTKLTFAGNFFNFALPGTTGGDLIKAYYVTQYTHRKTEAVTTIFLDRVVGLLGLMFLATAMFLFAWNRLDWNAAYRNSLGGMLALVWGGLAVGSLFVFSGRLRHLIRLPELAARLPAGQHLLRIGRATVAVRYSAGLILSSLAITVGLQLLVVVSAYVMALALGMRGSFELYFICVPIGFLIAAIPIAPPQAFGVMEWAYVMFFAHDGLNSGAVAVTFALANRLVQLVWALPGVLVPLLGAHVPSQAELSSLEEPEPEAEAAGADGDVARPQKESDSSSMTPSGVQTDAR